MSVPDYASCYECRWFETGEAAKIINTSGDVVGHKGNCKRHAPVVVTVKYGDRQASKSEWASTNGDDCCGEFEQHYVRQRYLHLQQQRKRATIMIEV